VTIHRNEGQVRPDLHGDVEFVAPPPVAPRPPDAEDVLPSARAPERRRVQLWPRSLSAKLVTGVSVLVLVVVLASGTATYFALRAFLYNRLDQQVSSVADQAASYIQRSTRCIQVNSTSLRCIIGGLPPSTSEYLAIITPDGQPMSLDLSANAPGPGGLLPLDITKAQAESLPTTPGSTSSITAGGRDLRVAAREVDPGFTVISGLSTDDVTRTLSHLVAVEIIIGALAIAIALLATSWGVQFSLRKLRRVTATAQEVAAELSPEGAGLERRVPVDEEGTEVGQLAESMNTLLSAVETQFAARLESERRMRQFLADASHELRTPLTSIRGFAELARMQRAAHSTEGAAGDDNLDRIEAEGTRMSRLVEDLLLLARGDNPDVEPVRQLVDVPQVIDDAVNSSRAAFPQRRIDIDAMSDHEVVGDPDQLVRAIRNLIANAAVHTAPERPIRVRAFANGPGVAIQVIDGGPGLPPEEAAHVFERFWRADKARSRVRGGSGLGLSIVASIARAHGGSVHFESTVERGSTVTIWLPSASE